MQLIIIRHGETEENRRGVIQGSQRGSLSALGKRQAETAGEELQQERLDAIYSSDLERAVATARPIQAFHPRVPLQTTQALREVEVGAVAKVPFRLPRSLIKIGMRVALACNLTVPGGESWRAASNRSKVFLNDLYRKYPHGTVVLVTHGVTIQIMHALLEGTSRRVLARQPVANGAIWRIIMDRPLA